MEITYEKQIKRRVEMALRVLMASKRLDEKKKELEEIRKKKADFSLREAELEKAIEEASTDEEKKVVEEEVEKFENEKTELDNKEKEVEGEVTKFEQELSDLEKEQEAEPVETPKENDPEPEKREVIRIMDKRNFFANIDMQTRTAIFNQDDVKSFLGEVRTAITQKRALTNVGLTIPEVFLGFIRENLIDYSKLYKHVNVKRLNGNGRMVIEGTIPEGVWTECCANLNELSLAWNDVEIDCYKVGGFFALCNAQLEDSDIDLANELLRAITQSIGYALDKAILYGTGTKMPLGIVTRLAQTEAPADYPATARTWVDLHTTNILSIAAGTKAAALISAIIEDSGAAKSDYSRGEKVWVCNEKTYTSIVAACVSVNAAGAIVAGVGGTMPVVGGVIEVLNFIPDNVLIGGYFDLYLLGERKGVQLAQSEHVRFIQDQTVFKGTARYDGQPAIAEGFVAIGLNGVTPTAAMTFATDTAN